MSSPIPPLGNLLIAFLAVLASFLFPTLPAPPFDSAMFGQILEWLLKLIAGWNLSRASLKSSLPTVRGFFRGL